MDTNEHIMKKILILDDNKDILNALHLGLCNCLKDCKILTATNGLLGIEIMQGTPINMVLTDLDMPVMNGYKFIEQVRRDYPEVPVCVMAGSCTPELTGRLASMGVRQVIHKPFQFDRLAELISCEMGRVPQAAIGTV